MHQKNFYCTYTKYQIEPALVLLRYNLNWADIQEDSLWDETVAALSNQLEWDICTAQSIFEKIAILSTSDGRVMVDFQINLYQHDNISEYPEPEEVYNILRKQLENGDWRNKESAGVLYYTISLECYTCWEFDIIDNPFAQPGTFGALGRSFV